MKVSKLKLNPYHNDFWYDENKYVIFYGSKGGGKSFTTAMKILYRISTEDSHNILCIHKIFNSIKDTLYPQFIDIIKLAGIEDAFECTTSPYRILSKNTDSMITFRGLDSSQKMGSTAGITSCWIEEAHFLTLEDWILINTSIGRAKKYKNYFQFILTFNPFGGKRHWLNTNFIVDNKLNASIYKASYAENEFISEDYEKNLDVAVNNKSIYDVIKNGIFSDESEIIIYNNWERYNKEKHTDISTNINDYTTIVAGIDYGFTHSSVCLVIGKLEDTIVVLDEIYVKGLSNPEFMEVIKKKEYPKSLTYYLESAEPDRIKEFKQAGFKIVPVKKSGTVKKYVVAGINYLQRFKIIIMPHCTNAIREISTYSRKYDASTDYIYEEPAERQEDDAMAALRYSVDGFLPRKENKLKACLSL